MDDYTILPGNQQMIRGIPIGRLNKLEQEVAQLEQNPGGSPGGSPTQLQYNNSGYFGGVSNSSVDTSSGAVGLGQTSPQAVLHVTPTPSPTSLSAVISSLGAGFYLLGSGDKEYNLYAKNSTVPIFASAISTTFTEPASTDFDPSGAGAVINTGESGYIASGFDFTYTIWALYGSSTAISVGSTSFGSVSDFNDGSPYAVDVSWSAPIGSVSPDAYLVQVTGSNPNSGLFQVVGGFPFTDSNTGWTSSASYNALSYNVALSWGGAATPIDGYVVQNGTTGTYETIGNTTSATDDGSWTVGVPVTTPIGKSKAAIFDGADMDVNGVSYHWPSSLGSGGIWKVDNTGDFFPSSVFQGDIPATNNLLVYGNGNALFQSINAFFDNNSMKFTSAFGTTVTTDNSSSGTLNNYSTVGISAVRFGGGSVTITGFTGGYSGKYLILITPVATTITLKNENTGSTAANRILTYNAVDNVIPASSAALLVYDPSNNRWRPISLGKVDPTITANTWALNQTFTDAANLIFGTSTGTKIGTSTTQKLAFYNSTPIVKPTGDVITALQNIGLIASATIAASTISSSFGANRIIFQNSGNTALSTDANFTYTAASGQAVTQATPGNAVQSLSSTTTNTSPNETVYQTKATTTNATITTLATITIPSTTTVMIEARVVARRTGGTSGTAEDGASYVIYSSYKNVSGTATEIGENSVFTAEDQPAWDCTFNPSSGNALLQVTGAANNNVSWVATIRTYTLSS